MDYFTPEQRKGKIAYQGDYFTFQSCADLSKGVTVIANWDYEHSDLVMYIPKLIADTANFTTHWMIHFHPKLKSFSGMDSVDFNFQTDFN